MLAWAEGSLGTEAGALVTSKPVHCGVCGHEGSVASHRRGGCRQCGTLANCRYESIFIAIFIVCQTKDFPERDFI